MAARDPFGLSFKKLGCNAVLFDPTDPENFRKGAHPRTQGDLLENLANPGGIVVDLERVASIAHEAGIPLIVDNTLATTLSLRTLAWAPTSSAIRPPKFLSAMAMRLGGIVVEYGRFDGLRAAVFRP